MSGEDCAVYQAAIKLCIADAKRKNNAQIIREIYAFLEKEYRNEYFYKNTLLNKLLLGVHSLNTTTALTEVPIAKSKADFVLINGKAVVYEIKSDLDNFERLKSQLADYYKAFSYVSVITSEDNYVALCRLLESTPTGICVLTKRNQISVRKGAEEYMGELDLDTIFKILSKAEYETILRKCIGKLPEVNQFEYYRTCKKWFFSLEVSEAHKRFIQALKMRYQVDSERYHHVPYELKFLAYFLRFCDQDYLKLEKFLNRTEGELCTSHI